MANNAPMPRFPPEIWSNIFIFSVMKDRSKTLPALMAVNHLFRSIANQTPQLWTHLVFEKPDHFTNLSRAKNLLQKSGSLPLDIYISTITYPIIWPFTTDIVCFLREQVPRLRLLELFVDEHDMADAILTAIGQNQPAPLLEELVVIEIEGLEDVDEDVPKFFSLKHAFHPAPRLTRLHLPSFRLKNLRLISTVRNLTLDATQFAEFDISEVVALLSKMTPLQSFTFNAMDVHSFGISYPQTLVTMPHLHFLEVTGLCGLDVLCHLKAPVLKEVSLDGSDDLHDLEDWEPLTTSIHHLSQNSPLITRIELKSLLSSTADLPYVFSNDAFPRLEVLRLDMIDIMDDTLRLCSPGKNLQKLELYNCPTPSSAGLLHFVERCNENFNLLIDSCRSVTQEDTTALSKFVKVEFVKKSIELSSGC